LLKPSLRPYRRPFYALILLVGGLLLTACGTRLANNNWPGLSTDGEKVYLAYGPGVLAYDVASQSPSWAFPAESSGSLQFYAAPDVDDGRVILGDYGQPGGFFSPRVTVSIYAREDTESGLPPELWTNSEVASDKIVAPALQANGLVFVGTSDNHILALDAASGTVQWDVATNHSVWGQPAFRDGVLYVNSMDHTVRALDAASGEEIWHTPLNGSLPSQPVLDGDLLYVSSFDGHVHALDIETGEEVWAAAASDWVWGAPAVADGAVYFGDIQGNLYAVNAESGELIWEKQTNAPIQTSPVVVDDMLYVASPSADGTTSGWLTAYHAADGDQLWQQTTSGPLYTTPVVVGDSLVVALPNTEAYLIGFDLESGTEQWRYTPPAS
jgi:outer membrane protein assembly factor BamB